MNSFLDPMSSMIEVPASQLIRATQEGAANAPGHDMKAAVLSGRGDL